MSIKKQVQLNESNKGFQLLEGMGWKLDEGLGKRKQGRVNPLQTTFKRDTTGLGAGTKLRPRVTHFPSHVPSQAANASDGKSDAVRAHDDLDRRGKRGRRFAEGRQGGRARSKNMSGSHGSDVSRGVSNKTSSGDYVGRGFWGDVVRSDVDGGRSGGSSSGGQGAGGRLPEAGRGRAPGFESGVFMSRKDRKKREEGEKRKERKTRFELFSDVPEEFAALFTG